MHCAIYCAEHRFCVAINYKEKTDGNEPNCQLTNTTEQKFDKNVSKTKRVWTFMKVQCRPKSSGKHLDSVIHTMPAVRNSAGIKLARFAITVHTMPVLRRFRVCFFFLI